MAQSCDLDARMSYDDLDSRFGYARMNTDKVPSGAPTILEKERVNHYKHYTDKMQLIFKLVRFGGKIKNRRKKRFDQHSLIMSEKDIKYNIINDKEHDDMFYRDLSFN